MERRYTALRTIGTVYKALGVLAGIVTILIVLSLCATSVLGGTVLGNLAREFGRGPGMGVSFGGVIGGVLGSLLAILYGGGLAVTLYAFGEGIYLLLALEENTRVTAALLQQRSGPQPSDQASE